MTATAVGLHSHKNGVNVVQGLGVVCFQNPALLAEVVLVENAEAEDVLPVRAAPAPGLEGTRIFYARLRIQIKGIENQSLALRIKDTSVGFVRLSSAGHIVDFGNIKIASAH